MSKKRSIVFDYWKQQAQLYAVDERAQTELAAALLVANAFFASSNTAIERYNQCV